MRTYWIETLLKIANPVWEALAEDQLRERMPVETNGERAGRAHFTHLEAVGRSLAGIAPWLELTGLEGEEAAQQEQLLKLVKKGLAHAVDAQSTDFLNFREGNQPVVDAAFLAHGFLRSWNSVWLALDAQVQEHVIAAMQSTRVCTPGFNNWLLFSAIVEAFLCKAGADYDEMRIDYALRQHEQWYKGDGIYGDGPNFHWDYYNSFVIQPMMYDIAFADEKITKRWTNVVENIPLHLQRYAVVLERFIAPDGSFPPIGRSLPYRFGAFQALAQVALQEQLPEDIKPAQVRCALDAVIHRMIDREDVFDENGWLRVGFCGHQPSIAEGYISTGSLYLCLCGMLPLGLPSDNAFWADADCDWTSKRIWSGEDMPRDHAIHH